MPIDNFYFIFLSISIIVVVLLAFSRRRARRDANYYAEKAARCKISGTKLETQNKQLQAEKGDLIEALTGLVQRFQPVIDIDQEILETEREKTRIETELSKIRASYAEKRKIFDHLANEVAIFDETISMAQLGMYSPHFQFEDSEQFKDEIARVRLAQKELISEKRAVVAPTGWTINGSTREGKKMADRAVRLSLRAFNNECDAAIGNCTWSNARTMEKRIQRSFDQINRLNETLSISINSNYHELKIRELRLTHEYREKKKEERSERAHLARIKREEDRLEKDKFAAEKEEQKYQNLLDKAKTEASKAVGPNAKAFQAKIEQLSHELAIAKQKSERAKSMAEQTKAGHIYVISNIGSFGDGVFKIGMTRRLDPNDRVRELGDASVPFLFDTHAMIFSENAPALEKSLHAAFDEFRVNKVNGRKEFFKVALKDIEAEVRSVAPTAEFVTGIEAQEYFETLAVMKEKTIQIQSEEIFPNAI